MAHILIDKTNGINSRIEMNMIRRNAVRAIIKRDNHYLMVLSKKMGDYKFPGGGIEENESNENALIREVEEETGYLISQICKEVMIVDEVQPDSKNNENIFHMKSIYYLCTIENEKKKQELDDYERALGFEAKWISIDEALKSNKKAIKNENSSKWIEREIRVLEKLKDLVI